jgi:hypothetical protein
MAMRTLFWFGGLGVVAVGMFYLASSQEPKQQTLGRTAQSSLSEECLSARLNGLSCISAPAVSEGCGLAGMPPQIIDVCKPQMDASHDLPDHADWMPGIATEHAATGIGANTEVAVGYEVHLQPVGLVEEAEPIGMPQVAEELPMPCTVLHDDVAEAEELPMPRCDDDECSQDGTACPFFQFWLGVFGQMDPADEAVFPAEDIAAPMEEVQEEPACEEDPHRSEHYPHCPYMGGRSCPAYHPASVPSRRCGEGEECEPEAAPQPGVDTMEFRPTDAKDGEFEAKPM